MMEGPQSFQDAITEVMVACEELRQPFKTAGSSITTEVLVASREDLDVILDTMMTMAQQLVQSSSNNGPSTVREEQTDAEDEWQLRRDLFRACQQRVVQVAQLILERILAQSEPQPKETKSQLDMDPQEAAQRLEWERRDYQACIARVTEINILLALESWNEQIASGGNSKDNRISQIIQPYVQYQRHTIRERCKPSIAQLVQERQDKQKSSSKTPQFTHRQQQSTGFSVPHSHVITTILGQASALIHPLLAWMFTLPPPPPSGDQTNTNSLVASIRKLCLDSIVILDEQAQTLTKTVSDWFWGDRHIDDWMTRSNHWQEDEHNGGGMDKDNLKWYLGELNALVEEMAFVCMVLARYQGLLQDFPNRQQLQSVVQRELSPEWTWKYASLERFLAMQQWKSALALATPVYIVLGTNIQVPSVVEDAQYLSTRALERAASTKSTQAIGTVAHSISSHIWSTEVSGGVYQALVDQTGCHVEEAPEQQQHTPATELGPSRTTSSTNSFASALLDALDDDIGKQATPPAVKKTTGPPSGPSSGGLLSTLVGVGGGDAIQQLRINTEFCNLNGIHSAAAACASLVRFLDSLLDDNSSEDEHHQSDPGNNSMIQLAREELCQYGTAYRDLLSVHVTHAVREYCGSVHYAPTKRKKSPFFPMLRHFFESANFELDGSAFTASDSDVQLERDLLAPLDESNFLQQVADKCDAEVLITIGEEIDTVLVELIIDSLLNTDPPRRFTDWGSLLLSKQIRSLQTYLSSIFESASLNDRSVARSHSPAAARAVERLSQVVTVLQLEKPSDWKAYQPTSVIHAEELRRTMQLRVDFSSEAINAIVGNNKKASPSDGSAEVN